MDLSRSLRRRRAAPDPDLLLFAAMVLACLVLLAAGATEPVRSAQRAVAGVLDPLRGAIAAAGELVTDTIDAVGEIGSLRDENDALQRRLAAAEQQLARLSEAARENRQLRGLLGLRRSLELELLPSRVAAREPSNVAWEAWIDAGSADGVGAGMPLVADAGEAGALLGTVIEADRDRSRVRWLIDPRSSVPALAQGTRALGEVRGHEGGQLTFRNVPATERLEVGDTVITAGLRVDDDASRYPAGLLIGRIIAVEPDTNGVTQTAYLEPSLDSLEVERLLVVTGIPDEQ